MTWLWVLPLLVIGAGLAAVALLMIRAETQLAALRLRTAELRTQHAEIAALRRDAAAVTNTARQLRSPSLRAAPGSEDH